MDTDVAALLIALCSLITSSALAFAFLLLRRGPRGPEGPPGPRGAPGTAPSLDAICDRVVEILDPRAGAELIRELGSRWPVAALSAMDERQFKDRGTFLLGLFLMGFTVNIWLLFGCIVIMTLGELIRTPVAQSFISKYAPEDARGQYMGASSLQFSIGRFLAPLTGGASARRRRRRGVSNWATRQSERRGMSVRRLHMSQ